MSRRRTELAQLISDIHQYGIDYQNRELYLHSLEYEDGINEAGIEYKMATSFIKNLNILSKQNLNPILVHMHSTGGNWSDGMAIFNAIRFCKCPITIISYAQASSMSGVILQAADYRVMMKDCEFMMHYGSSGYHGPIPSVKSYVDHSLQCLKKRMIEIFAKRAKVGQYFIDRKMSESKIKSFFDKKLREKSDWFLNSKDAQEYGLCDAILGVDNYTSFEEIMAVEKFNCDL